MVAKKQGLTDKEVVTEEIEQLEGKIKTISSDLVRMKAQVRSGAKISLEDLELTVKDINRLDVLMRERQDVGH